MKKSFFIFQTSYRTKCSIEGLSIVAYFASDILHTHMKSSYTYVQVWLNKMLLFLASTISV